MENEITTTTENKNVVPAEDYKAIAIHWLESTGNLKKFTEQQKNQFIDICVAYGLNPVKKEVYGIPYGNNFNLIVGYESYIKRAERSGRLDGWKVEINGTGADMKAVITIDRKDWHKPFVHEVYFEEYNTNQNLWKTKPRTMLKKVAIAQGFRMCFPEELGGMPYTADELPEEMTTAPTVEITNTETTSAENLRNVTPKETKPAKKYTAAQANEIKKILDENAGVFSQEEIDTLRQIMIQQGGEIALDKLKAAVIERTEGAN